ncbi:MAG: hypothetical protein AAGN82_30630 [Myxococcota bacterium]
MANYKVFNVRKKHEWLQTPLKKKRIKRRSAMRVGLWDAWERKGLVGGDAEEAEAEAPAEDAAAES